MKAIFKMRRTRVLVACVLVLLVGALVVLPQRKTEEVSAKTPVVASESGKSEVKAETVAVDSDVPAQHQKNPAPKPANSNKLAASNPVAPAVVAPQVTETPAPTPTPSDTVTVGPVVTTPGFGVYGPNRVIMPAGCETFELTIATTDSSETNWLPAWGGFEWADGVQEKPLAPVVAVLDYASTTAHYGSSLTYRLRTPADAAPGDYEVAFFLETPGVVFSVLVTVE